MSKRAEKLIDWLLDQYCDESDGYQVADDNHEMELYQAGRKDIIEDTILEVKRLWR